MRKILLANLLLLLCFTTFADGFNANYSSPQPGVHNVTFNIGEWDIEEVVYDGVSYTKIVFENSTTTDKKGWAELPFVSAAVQLPAQKNVDLNVVASEYKDYVLTSPLLPSRGVIYRNQNPNEIGYEIAQESLVNEFYPSQLATMDSPFIIREVRGTAVRVYPFQYNAVTNTLRVYSEVQVQLAENNEAATNPLMNETVSNIIGMQDMYESIFINYEKSRMDLPMAQFGELLVIYTERDQETIQQYIQWKREMGYTVHEEVVPVATNVKNLIQQKYDENNNILYVQLVGDWADVKVDNTIDASPVDPKMGCVVGTDNFPDIAIGRFSCSNATELTTQIEKGMNYEKNPNMSPEWYKAFTGVASSEGPGDDNENDTQQVTRVYTQRLEPGCDFNVHNQNYGGSASPTAIGQQINEGVSTIAYCGHGSNTYWVTSGFSNSHINQLTNGDKLPFIISVACVNGAYHTGGDCFGEAWLKKQNGGAVVTWMSTINQPWQPPMRGQDYFYDILIGGFNYDEWPGQSGINTNELRTTWGSITVNSLNLMLTESQTQSDIETAHTWATFGDVTLQLRTSLPTEISATNEIMLIGVPFETTIETEEGPVANAMVCIGKDGVYYSALTDENGYVAIENDFLPGEVELTVTGYNLNTISKTINCIAPDGPYLLLHDYQATNNEVFSYGEAHGIDLFIRNVGVEDANSVVVTITSEDEYVSFETPSATIPLISSNDTLFVENILSVFVEGNAPDKHVALCNLTMTCGDDSWTEAIELVLAAPYTELVSFGYEGQLLPGETLNITATFRNIGSYPIFNAYGTMTETSDYVTVITTDPVLYGDIINDSTTVTAAFTVTVSPDAPFGEVIPTTVRLEGDNNYFFEGYFEPFIDICNVSISAYPHIEGFEDVELPNCWTQEVVEGDGVWTTKKGGYEYHPYNAHTGEFNAFIHGEETTVKLISPTLNLEGATEAVLSFWHAQSVALGKQDYLRVYYKNATDGEWQLLAHYQYSLANWKQREIQLPDVTANYYIAFEAECNGGYGVVVDDVVITANIGSMLGDANNDGVVNVSDISSVVAYIMEQDPQSFNFNNADFNGDGVVNIMDITLIVNYIMSM